MGEWLSILLPLMLVVSRVTAFFTVLPLFGWSMIPVRVRVSIALLMSIFFAYILPLPPIRPEDTGWLEATILMVREIICGLGLGMVARLIFSAAQQGAQMGTQQMGLRDAGIMDPENDTGAMPISLLFQMCFAVLFLSVGGHHLLIMAIYRSYEAFPVGEPTDIAQLAEGVVIAGSAMLLFALKLAAPLLAGFLILAVALGVIARVMPEMNILMASMPLRVAVGFAISLLVLETLESFVAELTAWFDMHLFAT
jgi:flagellar biosynthetic protein FliR